MRLETRAQKAKQSALKVRIARLPASASLAVRALFHGSRGGHMWRQELSRAESRGERSGAAHLKLAEVRDDLPAAWGDAAAGRRGGRGRKGALAGFLLAHMHSLTVMAGGDDRRWSSTSAQRRTSCRSRRVTRQRTIRCCASGSWSITWNVPRCFAKGSWWPTPAWYVCMCVCVCMACELALAAPG